MSFYYAFLASFAYVALRSFQQLNVVNGRHWHVLPTSMFMAIGDMILVTAIAQNGISWIFLPIGIGGGLGALCAMWLHGRMGLS